MRVSNYIPRIVDGRIEEYLQAFGAVAVMGPKWCGKTTTCLNHAGSALFLTEVQTKRLAQMNPGNLFGETQPILLDEWQVVPEIWDAVRHDVDRTHAVGKFLLTGSAIPVHVVHSGAGRIARLQMKSMTPYESKQSEGHVSLKALFSGERISSKRIETSLDDIIDAVCRGGWPESIGRTLNSSMLVPRQYIEAICKSELDGVEESHRSESKLRALLRSLARCSAQMVNKSTLAKDIEGSSERPGGARAEISRTTLNGYLDFLKGLYMIEEQSAWDPALRSPVRLRTSPKWHFTDPSLAVAALGATPEKLARDLKTLEFLFESLCYRDLTVYADTLDAKVFHYHDNSDLEADAIIELPDGGWGAFEIKLGSDQEEEAASTLNRLENKMVNASQDPPRCKCVIVGQGEWAYTRSDGVHVVPVMALTP